MISTLTDTRRITEHDPVFLTLHAATVAKLRHSLDTYAQELQHATTIPSPNAFITRHTAILTGAYAQGHAEGARPFLGHYGASQGHPDTDRMHRTLSFYIPSVAKMAAEGLAAWQQAQQAKRFADPVPLDDEDYEYAPFIYAPFILDWAQGEPMGARLILQGNILWPAMQNGYLEAGAGLRTKLYWDLDPMAKVHCADCPGIAAASPYDPPGSGGNELNQTPGDGHTECGAGCRCALRYADGGDASTLSEGMIFYRPDQLRVKGRFAYEGKGKGSSGSGYHAPKRNITVTYGHGAEAELQRVLGRSLTEHEVGALVGAQHGAEIHISRRMAYPQGVNISVNHELYAAERHLTRDDHGEVVMHNDGFSLIKDVQGGGLGTRIFAEQVAALRAFGVSHIETHAMRSSDYNGYYTWARLGYDAHLSATLRGRLPATLRTARWLHDLMRTTEGRAWWKRAGKSFHGTFDLREGSYSMRQLTAYLKHRRIKIQLAEAQARTTPGNPRPTVEEIPWTDEDEAAADAAADEVLGTFSTKTMHFHGRGNGIPRESPDSTRVEKETTSQYEEDVEDE